MYVCMYVCMYVFIHIISLSLYLYLSLYIYIYIYVLHYIIDSIDSPGLTKARRPRGARRTTRSWWTSPSPTPTRPCRRRPCTA